MSILRTFSPRLAGSASNLTRTSLSASSSKFSTSSVLAKTSAKGPMVGEYYPTVRSEFLNEDGKVRSSEVAKAAGKAWNEMAEDEKKSYEARAKEAKDAYKVTYAKYYNALSPEELSILNKSLNRPLLPPGTSGMSTTQRKAIRRKDIGEPRYGLSGYLKFMEEFRLSDELKRLIEAEGDKITKANKATFTAKKGGEKWNMMSQSEKDHYNAIDADARQEHREWAAANKAKKE